MKLNLKEVYESTQYYFRLYFQLCEDSSSIVRTPLSSLNNNGTFPKIPSPQKILPSKNLENISFQTTEVSNLCIIRFVLCIKEAAGESDDPHLIF